MLRFVYFLLIPLFIFAQSSNWNSVIDLNLSVNSNDRTDIFANPDGIHIIIENGSTLKHYLYSSSGSQIRSSTIDGSISSTFSKIAGWDSVVYITYKEGSTIYTKESTNAGQSWSANINNISMDNSSSDGLEIWTDGNGLHIAYSELGNGSEFKTLYKRSEHVNQNWTDSKEVTDEGGVDGGRPSITSSDNRVHVGFTQEYDYSYSRDKYSSSWQSSQTISSYYPLRIILAATSGKLHALYSEYHGLPEYLYYRNRNLSGTSWSSSTLVITSSSFAEDGKPEMVTTLNDNLHMVYGGSGSLYYREWDSSLSSSYEVMEFENGPRISSIDNDIYVTGIEDDGGSGYELKMRQRDYAPIAPELNIDASGEHPVLSWNKTAPDLDEYKVYRKVVGVADWHLKTTTSNLSWTDNGVYLEYPLMTVQYKIKAYDDGNHASGYSNIVSCSGDAMNKISMNEPLQESVSAPHEFQLFQNFPNPFNPETTIRFNLAANAHITLKIYDLRRRLVSTLIDNHLESGSHKVQFNGGDLSSGIYIYKLQVDQNSYIKQMLLLN